MTARRPTAATGTASVSADGHHRVKMGNGAKAQQKRDRNAKDAKGTAKSQLKTNEASKTIICTVCRQAFMLTTRAPALEEHAKNKHSKTLAECFPNFNA